MSSGTRAVTVRARSPVGEDGNVGWGLRTGLRAVPPSRAGGGRTAGCRRHAEGEGTLQMRAHPHRRRVRTSARPGRCGQRLMKTLKGWRDWRPGDTAASSSLTWGRRSPLNAGIQAGDAVTVTAPKHTPTRRAAGHSLHPLRQRE